MKKPLAIVPAAQAGFENGSGMKFIQPRLGAFYGKDRIPSVKNETEEPVP